ncbi:zinc transporter ZIP1-like [Mytilus galloprovincialis]|uniref:Solute carrier family 39 (Zinc transporter), member 1/2/3 n=1 Tax=Mytilus galloprovincialis TaxID=29158 RepID=A0A8B6BL36_MYTGA|nr:solute carrier family 39 (zinc transporter), member 1/2/3 [Mytilus galloprovincialis]
MPQGQVDMDVVVAKILSLIILTVCTVLFGLFPCRLMQYFAKIIISKKKMFDYMISTMKCFSGGIFLGTCFLHLIPETRIKVGEVMMQIRSDSSYPVAELLTMAGFFGVIFTEHAIRALYKKVRRLTNRQNDWNSNEILPTFGCGSNYRESQSEFDCHSVNTGVQDETLKLEHASDVHEDNQDIIHDTLTMEIEPAPLQDMEVKRVVSEFSREGGDTSKGQIRSVLFITALSFHGVFEGMALGLQSLESNVWVLCFAITIHRGILAFGMGLQHMQNEERHSTIVFSISSFAVIAALGIIIGIAISTGAQLYTDVNVPNAILQSLATGTLFYIIFFDILYKEMTGNKDVKKISCTFVGFSVMAIVFAVTRQ